MSVENVTSGPEPDAEAVGSDIAPSRKLDRRGFLKSSGAGAAALMLGAGGLTETAWGNATALRPFQFGLVADAQYCNYPDNRTRHYRASLGKLDEAVDTFNQLDLAFTAHLGDFIDRDAESFADIIPIYDEARRRRFHLLGNHDFPLPSDEVVKLLNMPNQYYHFQRNGVRFIVLDTNDISLYANPAGSDKYLQAEVFLAALKAAGAVNAQAWSGAVGDDQMTWLHQVLARAERRREKVIVLSHMPVYPRNSHNVWNDEALIEVLESYENVVAYFNGHNHAGNYGEKNGIHYVNLHGMVELDSNAFSTVAIYRNRLEIDGYGREPDRVLRFARHLAPA